MYLFYIDESGNTGRNLDSADQPIHWLIALVATPRAVFNIESALIDVAREYCPKRARIPGFELHGGDLFHGRGECRHLTPDARIGFYGAVLEVIGRHGVRIFARGIHKARHKQRAVAEGYEPDHPHRLAMMYLIERLDEWLEVQPTAGRDEDQRETTNLGLLIADEQREVDREIVESFAWWRHFGTDHGYRVREIEHLIDTVHYVPSQDSWMIQLADCVAYLCNRQRKVMRESGYQEAGWSRSQRAVMALWRDHCAPCLEHFRVWP